MVIELLGMIAIRLIDSNLDGLTNRKLLEYVDVTISDACGQVATYIDAVRPFVFKRLRQPHYSLLNEYIRYIKK